MVERIIEYKEIPARMVEIDSFKCDICGTVFKLKYDARRCEKQHACQHPSIDYGFIEPEGTSGFEPSPIIGMEAICSNCNKSFGSIIFQEIEYSHDLLRALWETLAKHQGVDILIIPTAPSPTS